MATVLCRVQFLDDTDPFNSTNFPEPTRPPVYSFRNDIPLINQIAGVHRLLKAPHKIDDCTLQLSHSSVYLDLESTLEEQSSEFEGFQEDSGRGKKNSIILRTKLSVRVHTCIEKLYNSDGRELRRALFSLKQIFQDDKDLVQEFIVSHGLSCLLKIGEESDQNYQNYILRALGQIMLYVDGMNGIINHNETVQWLYTLIGAKFRLVVKTSLKLLLVFVEYAESNCLLLAQAVVTSDARRGVKPWSSAMEILQEKDGVDSELLVFVMTLINKTLEGLPDQDSFYDMSDYLEELGMEAIAKRYLNKKGTDLDLVEQFKIYEMTLKHEDGDGNDHQFLKVQKDRRRSSLGSHTHEGYVQRKSRRHSLQNMKFTTPTSNCSLSALTSSHGQNKDYFGERSSLGGLLTSSYRQHKESLAAERERRRWEREQRLQKIEREERNKFNQDYLDKREEQRQAREERYKNMEKIAAEEFAQEIKKRTKHFSDDASHSKINSRDCYSELEKHALLASTQSSDEGKEYFMENNQLATDLEEKQEFHVAEKIVYIEYPKEDIFLSEKEKQNEESNEKDNCSSSSISSEQGISKREENNYQAIENKTGTFAHCTYNEEEDVHSTRRCDPSDECAEEDGEDEEKIFEDNCIVNKRRSIFQDELKAIMENNNETINSQSHKETVKEYLNTGEFICTNDSAGNTRETIGDTLGQTRKEFDYIWDQLIVSPKELKIKDMDFTDLEDVDDIDVLNMELYSSQSPKGCPPAAPPPLNCFGLLPPPPPPISGCFSIVPSSVLPPALPSCYNQGFISPKLSRNESFFVKKKKTIRLFWNEVRLFEAQTSQHSRYKNSIWSTLQPIKLDTAKLEHLFESRSKEISSSKKIAADGKRQEITVLDSKRSNAINIGLTVLPPPRTIKMAILNFDEYALNKEGIDKILTMMPTEEEKQKIEEAQLANPDIPLGNAEQFLLTLSSISEVSARLQLWAFKMDFELVEKEIALALFDLKEGMEQLENNKTLGYILSTLLAIGNYLNGTNAKAFDLSYLEKVPEVKDTVQKQSLLHHLCAVVVEQFPDSTDLYSEISAITRCAKVDFDQLQDNLFNLERRCKASWDYLKIISKHEIKPSSKQKMSDFLKDCIKRIVILKIVHRRINNRFHSFLLFMGHPSRAIGEVNMNKFCKIISEFALEYRTSRERILQQKQKWQSLRERNKTRGKIITDQTDEEDEVESGGISKSAITKQICSLPHLQVYEGLQFAEDSAEHENMIAMLKISSTDVGSTAASGTISRNKINKGHLCSDGFSNNDVSNHAYNSADEIMDHIVKSATQVLNQHMLPKERKRSRANRKSLRRTQKNRLGQSESLNENADSSIMQV
ncbi:FH1/FH2 domain-containing protein 3 [Spea bombifrons]|uniref:FH1/FH2 domain-containing protein 3 n=1 Tax=Spea bombifrons TaxID=233779 RepID=UPI002349FD75|nr:FH1/FH2 domain-containing protein 3 [Spea bombifrons]